MALCRAHGVLIYVVLHEGAIQHNAGACEFVSSDSASPLALLCRQAGLGRAQPAGRRIRLVTHAPGPGQEPLFKWQHRRLPGTGHKPRPADLVALGYLAPLVVLAYRRIPRQGWFGHGKVGRRGRSRNTQSRVNGRCALK